MAHADLVDSLVNATVSTMPQNRDIDFRAHSRPPSPVYEQLVEARSTIPELIASPGFQDYYMRHRQKMPTETEEHWVYWATVDDFSHENARRHIADPCSDKRRIGITRITAGAPAYYESVHHLNTARNEHKESEQSHDAQARKVRYEQFMQAAVKELPTVTMSELTDHLVTTMNGVGGWSHNFNFTYVEDIFGQLLSRTRHHIAFGKVLQHVCQYGPNIDSYRQSGGADYSISFHTEANERRTTILRVDTSRNFSHIPGEMPAITQEDSTYIVESPVTDQDFGGIMHLNQAATARRALDLGLALDGIL